MMNDIDPSEGYRLLKEGELIIKSSDEVFSNQEGEGWIKCVGPLGNCAENVASYHQPIRRKIEDHWMKLSDSFPDKFPCQVWDGSEVRTADYITRLPSGIFTRGPFGLLCTHWKPLKLSDPPAPEVSADETHFYNWYKGLKFSPGLLDAWVAALAWERGRKK